MTLIENLDSFYRIPKELQSVDQNQEVVKLKKRKAQKQARKANR